MILAIWAVLVVKLKLQEKQLVEISLKWNVLEKNRFVVEAEVLEFGCKKRLIKESMKYGRRKL